MKTLFTEIYNKIMDLFREEHFENTSECATNRLQVILMHDRTKLDPLIMSKMREELIEVFSKYVVIDKEELEIGLKNEGDAVALMLNIPVIRAKTEEELEKIRQKLQSEETKVSDDDEDEKEEDEEASEENEKEPEKGEEKATEKKEEVIETVQGEIVEDVIEEDKKEDISEEDEKAAQENIVDAETATEIKSEAEK